MTRQSFFSMIFTMMMIFVSFKSFSSGNYESASANMSIHSSARPTPDVPEQHDVPLFPAAQPVVPHGGKTEAPKSEELAHIHHFHKERVKKMKRHHEKFWFLSKLLLVICHLLLLFVAYLHVTH